MTVVDLFAGPGGWDIAARSLGLDPIGIEYDADACATRAAAGLTTIRADIRNYWPTGLDRLDGLIASPPCPAFSAAGTRSGIADLDHLAAMCDDDNVGGWERWTTYAAHHLGLITLDAVLLAEPLAWVDRWEPTWLAFEQVPPVLPFWQATARWLTRRGYSAWAGVLCAADFGVPQRRHRAILLAHRDRPVAPPTPTHAEHPQQRLFGDPELPWVTMAQALGWDGALHANVDQRPDGTRQVAATTRPAPTISTRSAGQWKLNPHENCYPPQQVDTPARTITGSAWKNWVWERPATTVAGDHRIWPPGHRINSDDVARLGVDEAARRYSDRAGTDAIRVTTAELAALQTFPPGYPFVGTKTAVGRQIGNAVPPLLARRLLEQVAR